MNEIDVNSILTQMRTIAAEAADKETSIDATQTDFAKLLKQGVDAVNDTQQQAGQLAQAFDKGDPNVELVDVMVSLQKASLSFRAMTEVRNRLVSAYQEIMNMPI